MKARSMALALSLSLLAGCASRPQLPPIRGGAPISLTVVTSAPTDTHAAVRDNTWNDLVWTVNTAAADIFVGVALVVASRRNLTAGDVTLFASYLIGMVWLPMRLGGIIDGGRLHGLVDLGHQRGAHMGQGRGGESHGHGGGNQQFLHGSSPCVKRGSHGAHNRGYAF